MAIVALNPISSPPPPEALGRRLDSLRGATVGFFSNNKPNADVLLERTAVALQARFNIAPRFFTKAVPSLEAGDELLCQCGETCQAVVLAALD
jgi:hypothetical protein